MKVYQSHPNKGAYYETEVIATIGEWTVGVTPKEWEESKVPFIAFHSCEEANVAMCIGSYLFRDRLVVCFHCHKEAPEKIKGLLKLVSL